MATEREEDEMKGVVIRIKRPEGYDDVHAELVVTDFIETASHGGWEWEIVEDEENVEPES